MNDYDKATIVLKQSFVRLAEESDTPKLRGELVADISLVLAEVLSTVVVCTLEECDCCDCRKAQELSIEEVYIMTQELVTGLIDKKMKAKGMSHSLTGTADDTNTETRKEILREMDT